MGIFRNTCPQFGGRLVKDTICSHPFPAWVFKELCAGSSRDGEDRFLVLKCPSCEHTALFNKCRERTEHEQRMKQTKADLLHRCPKCGKNVF